MLETRNDRVAAFSEQGSIERGFKRVFDAEIAPRLAVLTGDSSSLRSRTLRDFKLLAGLAAIIFIALTIVVDAAAGAFAVIAVAILAGYLVYRRQSRWEQQVIDAVLPSVCAFLDLRHSPTRAADDYLAPFERLGVVGSSNRRALTHHFTGTHRGTGFEFVQAELTRRSGGKRGSSSPVFHGLLFRIQVPVNVPTRILITPNFGTITRKIAMLFPSAADEGMKAITFDDPAFDEKFAVTAALRGPEDEAGVRSFLSPSFRSALLAINEAEGRLSYARGAMSAAFMGDTFYLSLSRFEARKLGPITYEQPRGFMRQQLFLREQVDLEKAIHEMFNDVATACRIIDRLHEDAATEAPGST
jgi:hypothetical protein